MRLYDPMLKRFLQPDPVAGTILRPITINPYLYCMNDPVNYIDPDGRIPISIFATMMAVTAAVVAVSMISPPMMGYGWGSGDSGVGRPSGDDFGEEAVLPSLPFDVLFNAVARVATVLALEQMARSAGEWTSMWPLTPTPWSLVPIANIPTGAGNSVVFGPEAFMQPNRGAGIAARIMEMAAAERAASEAAKVEKALETAAKTADPNIPAFAARWERVSSALIWFLTIFCTPRS